MLEREVDSGPIWAGGEVSEERWRCFHMHHSLSLRSHHWKGQVREMLRNNQDCDHFDVCSEEETEDDF